MFQYFRPHHATTPSATTSKSVTPIPPSNDEGHRNDRSNIDLDNSTEIASSAILIFPNPPSDQESSRSASESRCEFSGSSTLSLPTDVSYSIDSSAQSTSRSRNRREREQAHDGDESWQSMLRTLSRDCGWDELLLEEQSEWELERGYLRQENTRFRQYPPRGHHTCTSSGPGSPLSLPFSLSPQPPFHLPFLSFLRPFLTLDESTLHLISRSPDPHVSSLFPVSPGLHSYTHAGYDDAAEDGDDEPPHGALRLLLNNPDKSQSTIMLKAGIESSEMAEDANTFLVSPTRIPVWRLLKFVIEGGVRAWREVRAWEAGDMRLMGV